MKKINKQNRIYFFLVLLTSLLYLGSCTKPDESKTDANCNVINVSATIDSPTTWSTGNVYLITQTLTITSTLTIQAGTVIKIKGASIELQGNGRIVANGTENNRITFTSFADDKYCGDSNGDGNATSPQKGDWIHIYHNSNALNQQFIYCDFLYAGKNYGQAVNVAQAVNDYNFDHCTFAHIKKAEAGYEGYGYTFYGSRYMEDAAKSKFTNNAIYDGDRPIFCSPGYTLDTSNIFHNPNNDNEKNTRNGVFLVASTTFNLNIVRHSITEIPYVFDTYYQLDPSKIFVIDNGVIFKFKGTTSGFKYLDNDLSISPTAVLTSYKDDIGGDTNGDGITTIAVGNEWIGVLNSNGIGYLHGPNIRFATN